MTTAPVPNEQAEAIEKAAMVAQSMGRSLFVFLASKDGKLAEYVGIAFVEEVLKSPMTANIITLPRRDALLLMSDLESALGGEFQSIDEALRKVAAKGPKA